MEAEVKNKSDNIIRLKKRNTLRFKIETDEGIDTGEYLEFDLDDIELPLKLKQCEVEHRKNIQYLKNQFIIIDKKEDKKGKYLLSWKEEERQKAIKEFYNKEMKTLDLFLGKDGTKKLLNGKEPYYEMYNDIVDELEPIMPKLQLKAEDITKKIKEKYSNKKEEKVLE